MREALQADSETGADSFQGMTSGSDGGTDSDMGHAGTAVGMAEHKAVDQDHLKE